jgi:hypothetical protein
MKDDRDPWDEAFHLLEETKSPAMLATLFWDLLSKAPSPLPTDVIRRLAEAFTPKNFDEEVTIERRKTMTPLQNKKALRDEGIINAMREAVVDKGLKVEDAAEEVAKIFNISDTTVRHVWGRAVRLHPWLSKPFPGKP